MDRGDAPGVTGRTLIALAVAGSDSSAGAGIQADLRTFAALGVHAATAITALTAQNTRGVRAIHLAPPDVVAAQIEAVMEDFAVAAIKIGMLGSVAIVEALAERLSASSPQPSPAAEEGPGPRGPAPTSAADHGAAAPNPSSVAPQGVRPNARLATGYGATASRARGKGRSPFIVYDPVMAASSGDALSGAGFVESVRAKLLPRVDCLTPNLAEAAALLGEGIAEGEADMARQGRALIALGARAVLVKGGHLEGDDAIDLLVTADGVHRFAAPRLASNNLHGTGCTLSSSIAAHVVLGKPLPEAVAAGKAFVREAIEAGRGLTFGAGAGPLIQMKLRR
jgi:hydroxymethylpyrimidine/phosphomethylpyrimidine kinase